MKEQKLVITGMGAVTPIGIGVDAYWSALVEGQCGVGKITRFDASELPVQIAAELKDFDPAAYMPKTLARTMDPFMQFAFVAAEEALKNSELSIESESDRIGIVMGTAMDGVTTVAQTQAAFDTGKRVGPRFGADDHRQHRCRPDLDCSRHSRPEPDTQYGMLGRRRRHHDRSDAAPLRRGRRGSGSRRRKHSVPDRGFRSVAGQGAFPPKRRPRAGVPPVRP